MLYVYTKASALGASMAASETYLIPTTLYPASSPPPGPYTRPSPRLRLSQIVQLLGATFGDLSSVQQMLQHLEAQLSTFNISYSPVQYLSPKTLKNAQNCSKCSDIADFAQNIPQNAQFLLKLARVLLKVVQNSSKPTPAINFCCNI